MKLLWYIVRHSLFMILMVLLVITGIDFIFTFIGEIKNISVDGYTSKDALLYVLLRMPADINLILPIAAFLGNLICLISMAAKSEIIVMRASGFSIVQLAKALLFSAAILMFFYYLLGFFIAPYATSLSYREANFFSNKENVYIGAKEIWLKSADHFLLLGLVSPRGDLQNVTDFEVEGGALTRIRQIQAIHLNGDHTWTLSKVTTTVLDAKEISTTYSPRITEPGLISTTILPAISMTPDEMNIKTLYQYIHYRQQNHLDSKQYKLQFWNQIFAPLMLPVMLLLALPFVLQEQRSKKQIQVIAALVLGFSFFIIGQFFGSFTLLTEIPAWLGALAPTLIFSILLLLLLWRIS